MPAVFRAVKKFQQFLITGKSGRRNCFQCRFQFFQQTHILDVLCGIFFIKLLQPLINTLYACGGTGKQRFFQTGLKQLAGSFGFSQIHFQLHLGKNIKSMFFLCGGIAAHKRDFSFQKSTADLVFYIFFEAANAQSFNIFGGIVFRVGNGCGIQHVHQRSKTLCPTVVRRCGQHDHGITAICKQLGQTRTLGLMVSPFRNILRLIDHDNIPICIFQVRAVFNISFQCVNRNDCLIIIEKRIIVRR